MLYRGTRRRHKKIADNQIGALDKVGSAALGKGRGHLADFGRPAGQSKPQTASQPPRPRPRAALALIRLAFPSGYMPAPAKTAKSRPRTAPSTRDCVGRRRAPHGADEILAGGDAGAGDLLVGGVAKAGEILAGGARPPGRGRGRRRAE